MILTRGQPPDEQFPAAVLDDERARVAECLGSAAPTAQLEDRELTTGAYVAEVRIPSFLQTVKLKAFSLALC